MPSAAVTQLLAKTPTKHNLVEFPRMGIRVLVQWWPEQNDQYIGETMDYLQTIPSVVDPTADVNNDGPIVYAGTWRVADVTSGRKKGVPADKQGIYRTLVSGTFADAAWMVIKDDCEEKVEMAWFWNVAAPVSPYDNSTWGAFSGLFTPTPGSTPGVIYSGPESLAYFKEWGTYSFTLTRTTYQLRQTASFTAAVSAGATVTKAKNTNVNSATNPELVASPTYTKGVRQSLELTKLPNCLFESEYTNETPNDLPGIEKSEDTFEKQETDTHTENPTDILAGDPDLNIADGTSREMSSKETDVGNFITSDAIKTGKTVSGAEAELKDTAFAKDASRTDRNQTLTQIEAQGLAFDGGGNLTAPVQVPRVIITASAKKLPLKNLWDVTLAQSTAKTVLEAQIVKSDPTPFSMTVRTVDKNLDAPTVLPARVDGVRNVFTPEKTDYLTFNETREVETANRGTLNGSAWSGIAAEQENSATLFEAKLSQVVRGASDPGLATDPTAPPSLYATGILKQVSAKKTDLFIFDISTGYQVSLYKKNAGQTTRQMFSAVENIAEHRNVYPADPDSVLTPPVFVEGASESLKIQLTDADVTNAERVKKQTTPWEFGDSTFTDYAGEHAYHWFGFWPSAQLQTALTEFAASHPGMNIRLYHPQRDLETGTFHVMISAHEVNETFKTGDAFTTGATRFTYTNQKTGQKVYIYKLASLSLVNTIAWMNNDSNFTGTVVGYDGGHKTDWSHAGNGRVIAMVVSVE